MSSERDKDGYVEFECDRCGAVHGGEEKDFQEAWQGALQDGWKYFGQGRYLCGVCAEEAKL